MRLLRARAPGPDRFVHCSLGCGCVTRPHAANGGRACVIGVDDLARHEAIVGAPAGGVPR